MAIRVGINGFGRIGRTVFRIISQNPDRFELCGINLRNLNMEYMAYTALYDSVHGHFPGTIEAGSQHLIVNGKPVRIFSESDPANIEWSLLRRRIYHRIHRRVQHHRRLLRPHEGRR